MTELSLCITSAMHFLSSHTKMDFVNILFAAGLKPGQYRVQSPVSSAYNDAASVSGSTGQPKRRRKKRSQHNRDLSTHNLGGAGGGASRSNPGSGRDYNTNTDLSSGGK